MTRYIPPRNSKRQQALKWMNMLAHVHDLICDCYNPIEHTAAFIFEQEKHLKFTPPEKDTIKQCLFGENTTTTAGDQDVDGLDAGTLEELFKEDAGDEKDSG